MTARADYGRKSPPEAGARELLDHFAEGDPEEVIRLDDVLAGLEERAFGMLLFLSIPTAFIPGIAGVISGPLVILVGVQLLFGRNEPWLPNFLGRLGPHRRAMTTFRNRLRPWLSRLERVVKPRAQVLLDHPVASAFTGLNLILLGLLLSLPIPFTNVLFAMLLLLFALALLERDGRLLAASWATSVLAIAVFGVLSGSLATAVAEWLHLLN
ncbi:exopolysaccharide biosynthesis protein [Lysobacter niabensis]|uniref:exopolysaccharide biosynthesis protein n=1 Tax=Agrilutibacter niabensis TaxID=380628 RepID=UPI003621D513